MRMTEKQVDDLIDLWHKGGGGTGKELFEFLGWTREEYFEWVNTNAPPEMSGCAYMRATARL
jgi:hypothetical protein